ncbi:MAG: hypothetical protein AAF244_02375 [Pseudomonadota bacterium]
MAFNIRYYGLIMLACLVWQSPSYATDFFESLYDVPILLDLEEIPEKALVFDKPSGRIARSAAYSSHNEEAVLQAYHQALPEMGWQKLSETDFRRKDEILSISIIKSDTSSQSKISVEFSLKPAEE